MIYDNSQLTQYQDCPRKYYLKFIQKLAPYEESQTDLIFGQYVHKALERHYKGESAETVRQTWDDYPLFPGEETKTKEGGLLLVNNYLEHYRQIDGQLKVIDVEKVVKLLLGVHTFLVKVDTIVEINEQIYGLEHKTTGNLSFNFFDRYFINSQISAQHAAIIQEYGKCDGIIVNAMEIKNYKRNYKEIKAGLNTRYDRSVENRTPQEIKDWKLNAIATINQINLSNKLPFFPKSDGNGACDKYRGCEFKRLCKVSHGMKQDEQIVETLYKKVEDPLAYLKE